VAAAEVEPLVVQLRRHARTVLRIMRDGLEYVLDARPLPGLQPPMAVDDVPAVSSALAAPGLV